VNDHMASADTKSKPKRKKLTQKEQSERFRQTARDISCDESEDALEQAFEKIVLARTKSGKGPIRSA